MNPISSLRYGALARLCKFSAVIIFLNGIIAHPAIGEPTKIVALGDSLVQGYGLAPEHGFVAQMQIWLNEQNIDVEIVNAGVSGDTTTGGLARLDWALTPDTDALIVSLGGNDVLRAIPPALAEKNLRQILQEANNRSLPVLLIGINVPPNYGEEYQAQFGAIYPTLAAEFETLYYEDFLLVLTSQSDRNATFLKYFQSDGLHPNSDGVALIVEEIGPLVIDLARQSKN